VPGEGPGRGATRRPNGPGPRQSNANLRDEAVEACPPSAGYRVQKFLRRHWAGVVDGIGLLRLLLLAGVGGERLGRGVAGDPGRGGSPEERGAGFWEAVAREKKGQRVGDKRPRSPKSEAKKAAPGGGGRGGGGEESCPDPGFGQIEKGQRRLGRESSPT